MKKNISYIVFIFLLIVFMMFILSKCSNMTDSGIKKNIVGVVEDNKEILIEAISTGNYKKIYDIKAIEDITVNDDCVVFYCKGRGIAPSSQEYGFYYLKNNLPIAIFDGKPIHYFENDVAVELSIDTPILGWTKPYPFTTIPFSITGLFNGCSIVPINFCADS